MKIIKSVVCILLGGNCGGWAIADNGLENIIVGRGSGIVWEGQPFEMTYNLTTDSTIQAQRALVGVGTSPSECIPRSRLVLIDGVLAFPIAQGIGVVPRITVSGSYWVAGVDEPEVFNGTIGLPETAGTFGNSHVTADPNYPWCLSPRMGNVPNFYEKNSQRVTKFEGSWVIVADGTQVNGTSIFNSLSVGTYQFSSRSQYLFGSSNFRVSTLECTVDTVTGIAFGSVDKNPKQNSELAIITTPLNITCGQPTSQIDANINVQFRAISGLYNNTPTQLSLDQGGGYITGEINNVTGSGDCELTDGITFDSQQIKLGNITTADSTKVLNNNVTWRLCSGGSNLPVGDVTASTEMLVTFN